MTRFLTCCGLLVELLGGALSLVSESLVFGTLALGAAMLTGAVHLAALLVPHDRA